ncbi:hypothetical protein KMW28_20065 [Flammeovirga yaeyamensis]|uniref:Secreted protein n=1 Tax=Flammeovirga yaeyamensis TaxID=367791 RepID=A0AAX1N659_9BACT|nr:hypothetical protein [Flammeovirga yaeyamensis]MBB3701037.1 hypothetical protein [Flammeovirga yaeyamensis]NMF38130.1 hypothetical protein [Flammeovirga yaeyamensis]QWG01901.1 hypothetical protein KMW28_20065 [Flammeovirga yaeyamensis]
MKNLFTFILINFFLLVVICMFSTTTKTTDVTTEVSKENQIENVSVSTENTLDQHQIESEEKLSMNIKKIDL